jgi:hypothetical protein
VKDLRREMVDSTDAPAELSPELAFLASRQASLGALLLDHAEHYKVLYAAVREHGTTEEIQSAALDAAGNLGTVLQSLRSREDLQLALAHAPGYTPTPLIAADQLFFSFTLLAGAGAGAGAGTGDATDTDTIDAALPPEGVDELFGSQHVRDWLHGLGELAPGE